MSHRIRFTTLVAFMAHLSLVLSLPAQEPVWTGNTSGAWGNISNWVPSIIPGAANTAYFYDPAPSAHLLTTLGTDRDIAKLYFDVDNDLAIGDLNETAFLRIGSGGIDFDDFLVDGTGDVTLNMNLRVNATQIWTNYTDDGVLTVAGNLELLGNLTLNNVGAIERDGSFVIGSNGKKLINSGAGRTLNVNNGDAATDLTIHSDIQLTDTATNGRIFTINTDSGAVVDVNGAVTDTGFGTAGLTKNGTGTLNLNGALTYRGTTIVNAGILNASSINTAAWTFNGGVSTFTLSTGTVTTGGLTFNAGTANFNAATATSFTTGGLTFNGGTANFTTPSATSFTTGAINFASGTANFNIPTGVIITTGSLTFGHASTIGVPVVNFGANRTLSLAGDITARNLGATPYTLGVTTLRLNGSRTITIGANTTFVIDATIENGSANSRIHKAGDGTLILKGTNNSSGTNNALSRGTLILDYTVNNTKKLSETDPLSIYNGHLILIGNATADTTQKTGAINLTATDTIFQAANHIILQPGAGRTLTFEVGAIQRASGLGHTLHFEIPDRATVKTSLSDRALIAGWATLFDGDNDYFAAVSGGEVTATVITDNDDVTRHWAPTLVNKNVSDESGYSGATDQMRVNSVRFSADGTLNVVHNLHIETGGLLVARSSEAAGIFGGTLTVGTGNELIITQNSEETFEISSNIRRTTSTGGGVNITKSGEGELILSGDNWTGQIETPTTASAEVRINEGTLTVKGGRAISDHSSVIMQAFTPATFKLEDDETIGNLYGVSTKAVVTLGANTLTVNTSGDQTFSGSFTGSGTLVKNNLNPTSAISNWILNSSSSDAFTGNIIINAGALQLAGSGVRNFDNVNAVTINQTGALLLDNSTSTSDSVNPYTANSRLNDNATIILNGANGRLASNGPIVGFGMLSGSGSVGVQGELVKDLNLNSGASYVLLNTNGDNDASLIRVTNAITRANGATLSVRGFNLSGGGDNRTRLHMAAANSTAASIAFANQFRSGGAYANGTTALATLNAADNTGTTDTTISIVPWAIGENLNGAATATTNGNTFVAFEADVQGFVPLHLTNQYTTYAAATANTNVRINTAASVTDLTGKTINSLIVNNSNNSETLVTISGTGTLGNTSGAFLFTGVGAVNAVGGATANATQGGIVISGFSGIEVTGPNKEYIMFVTNTSTAGVTINSNLTTADAKFTKSGLGLLKLTGNNSALSDVTLNEGTLEISNLDNIGGTTGGLTFAGGTLRLASDWATADISGRTLRALGGTQSRLNTNGKNVTASVFGEGDGTFIKSGAGTLTLTGTGDTQHTGLFIVENGSAAHSGHIAQLILDNASGVAIGGDLQIGAYDLSTVTGSAAVQLRQDEQIADHAVISFNATNADSSGKFAHLQLFGHTETVAGIQDVSGAGVIENSRDNTHAGIAGYGGTGHLILDSSDDFYYGGTLRNTGSGGGVISITKTGSGTQTLAGSAIVYTGVTTIEDGRLRLRDTTDATGTIGFNSDITNDAILELERTVTGTTWDFAKIISGSGELVKTGSGVTRLSGINTYSGTTTVEAGSLSLGASGSISNSRTINIKHGAELNTTLKGTSGSYAYGGILTGNGTVKGNFTLSAGGSLRAGASSDPSVNATTGNQLGKLTFTGNTPADGFGKLTLTGGGATGSGTGGGALLQIISATFNDAAINTYSDVASLQTYLGTQAGTWDTTITYYDSAGIAAHDFIDVDGAFTWDTGSTVKYEPATGFSLAAGDVLNLWDWASLSGTYNLGTDISSFWQRGGGLLGDLELPTLSGGLLYDLSQFTQYGIVVVVAPEPGRALLLLLGLGVFIMRRRKA